MTHEPMERDAAVADALAELAADRKGERVNWTELRRAVNATAAAELTRRRRRQQMRFAIPVSLVAGFVLFMVASQAPDRMNVGSSVQSAIAGQPSIDELLDADISDRQFRELVSGATEANDLLSIAAAEDKGGRAEER